MRVGKIAWRLSWAALAAVVFVFALVQLWFFSQVMYWSRFEPGSTAFMERRLESLRAHDPHAVLHQEWLPYVRISAHLKRAVVAAEDAKFLDHEGFDWLAIQKALEKNVQQGKAVAGASTISQQLAKNLFLSGERSLLRKGEEALITWMLEAVMSKRRILELYLNYAEWGEGVFGAESAARYHFGIGAAALNPEEAAWLAAILPSPRRYKRGEITPYSAQRAAAIASHMDKAQIP
ncbi:MAG TPA: monofunctional biosynthetic peptidoglycan transglycosylase [Burkholderiales bacterium]